jgi:hypothetical protein
MLTTHPSSAEVKYELELYLLSPHVPPWHVAGQLYFYFTLLEPCGEHQLTLLSIFSVIVGRSQDSILKYGIFASFIILSSSHHNYSLISINTE